MNPGVFFSGGSSKGLRNWVENSLEDGVSAVTVLAANKPCCENVSAVIQPKGTGALTTSIPDSTSLGGVQRGINAVDLQVKRTNSTQVAIGNYSVISGGESNQSRAAYSTVGGGLCNTVSNYAGTISGGEKNKTGLVYENLISSAYCCYSSCCFINQTVCCYTDEFGNTQEVTTESIQEVINEAISVGGVNVGLLLQSEYSVISGGINNFSFGYASLVGGGECNIAESKYSSVLGGYCNTASGYGSTIVGGVRNNTNGRINSFIVGANITATRDFTTYVNNLSIASMRTYPGNQERGVCLDYDGLLVVCAEDKAFTNFDSGAYASVVYKPIGVRPCDYRLINETSYTTILPGFANQSREYCGQPPFIAGYNLLLGGEDNLMIGNRFGQSFGKNNYTCINRFSSIINGYGNYMTNSLNSVIVSGDLNAISNRNSAFILGSCLTADRDCATFVNNLSIKNIPTSPVGLPSKSLWYCDADCVVRIIP